MTSLNQLQLGRCCFVVTGLWSLLQNSVFFVINVKSGTARRGYRGGPGAGAPPPWSSKEGARGATIRLNNYLNSLKTRLKYIKITLKVNLYKKKSGFGPHRIFSEGDRTIFRALHAQIYQALICWPPPPGKILYPRLGTASIIEKTLDITVMSSWIADTLHLGMNK